MFQNQVLHFHSSVFYILLGNQNPHNILFIVSCHLASSQFCHLASSQGGNLRVLEIRKRGKVYTFKLLFGSICLAAAAADNNGVQQILVSSNIPSQEHFPRTKRQGVPAKPSLIPGIFLVVVVNPRKPIHKSFILFQLTLQNVYSIPYQANSHLENSMHGGAWQASVRGIASVGHDLATKTPPL